MQYDLDRQAGILHVQPQRPLREEDFAELRRGVEAYVQQAGRLAGIIVETERFPGWEDFDALLAHLRFVKDHHRQVRKVAMVTDSPLGAVAERLAAHFVAAEIRRFAPDELPLAREWIATG